ncbi:hypothetical protein D1643_06690 [Enterorhabdus sp. P55]|nr:hypothetical protein [Enterorhabdus sp. P55]
MLRLNMLFRTSALALTNLLSFSLLHPMWMVFPWGKLLSFFRLQKNWDARTFLLRCILEMTGRFMRIMACE